MGSTGRVVLSLLFILGIVLTVPEYSSAGRNIPKDSDKKQPQGLGYDGTVLIPGLGRYVVPKEGTIINPFTYNPITGQNGGNGLGGLIGGQNGGNGLGGMIGGLGGGNIPGGDDTFGPNPWVEVPNPVGGSVPTPPGP